MNVLRYVAEDGTVYRTEDAVQRVDYESDGTPEIRGVLTRIEITSAEFSSSGEDEVTFWVTWEGTAEPDPHGSYAFRLIEGVNGHAAMGYASEHYCLDLETLATSPEDGGKEFSTPFGPVWLRRDA